MSLTPMLTAEDKLSKIFCSSDADFQIRSCDGLVLKVKSAILCESSDVFRALLALPQTPSQGSRRIPIIDVTESGDILELLIQYIYPGRRPALSSFGQYSELLEAAAKYAVDGTIDILRAMLVSPRFDPDKKTPQLRPSFAEQDPLRAYAISTTMGWKAEAVHTSTLTLRSNLSTSMSSAEIDNMPTKYYRWLTDLHDERRIFFNRLLEDFDDEPSEFRIKKCKECGQDPVDDWFTEYVARARVSIAARPAGDRIFDLNFLFPPDDDAEDYGCNSCPVGMVPLQTLHALSKLKQKLSKKKESVRHRFGTPAEDIKNSSPANSS